MPYRVLVADDSPSARRLIVAILDADPELTVIGEAVDGWEAVRMAAELQPDVITMDIHMPRVDGLEATRKIMIETPRPIVVVSAHHDSDVSLSFKALEAGALTILQKPPGPTSPDFTTRSAEMARTVRLMAELKVVRRRQPRGVAAMTPPQGISDQQRRSVAPVRTAGRIQLIGVAASTGGPNALSRVLGGLPGGLSVPMVVVQHIAPGYHAGLARWLDGTTPLNVRLADDGEPLAAGSVLIAPEGYHLGVTAGGRIALSDDPPIAGHRPSATHMFRLMAESFRNRCVGIVLTGMGDDGAAGLAELKRAGSTVFAQDEASSVVYGMPREAVAAGAVDRVLDLDDIAPALAQMVVRT